MTQASREAATEFAANDTTIFSPAAGSPNHPVR